LTFFFSFCFFIEFFSCQSEALSIINESWSHLSGRSDVIDSVVAASTGLLSLAQKAPFVGPAAGALLMFYQTYEQCQENKGLFEDFRKKVEYCKTWVKEMSDKKNLFSSSEVIVSSYKEFFLVLSRAIYWMRKANNRYKENPSLINRASGMILAEADQSVMNDHISRIDNSLMHFKTDISSVILLHEEQSKVQAGIETRQTKLKDLLRPFQFKDIIHNHKKNFLENSRKWILELFDKWLLGDSTLTEEEKSDVVDIDTVAAINSNLFWVRADAGMGKSVLAAKLVNSYADQLLGAVFFNFTDSKLSDPSSIINSLAYQIAEKFCKKYPEILSEMIKDANELAEAAISDRFEKLVLGPLNRILVEHDKTANSYDNSNFFLVIDALDECELGQKRSELLSFLGNQLMKKFPKKIKVLITSRPELDIINSLKQFKPFEIKEKDPRHEQDLKLFISSLLPKTILKDEEDLLKAIEIVFDRSQGKFVYASLVKQELENCLELPDLNELMDKLQELPEGIDGYFMKYFKKLHDEFEYYKEFLYCMVASMETFSYRQLKELLLRKGDAILKKANQVLGKVFLYRKQDNGQSYFIPFHKSIIDWLTDKNRSHEYYIDKEEANEFMISR
jgi:hypothetical protein